MVVLSFWIRDICFAQRKMNNIFHVYFKFQVTETNTDSVVQASKAQLEGELITLVDSFKKENKKLMAKINLRQTRLSHVIECYTPKLYQNAQINQDMTHCTKNEVFH